MYLTIVAKWTWTNKHYLWGNSIIDHHLGLLYLLRLLLTGWWPLPTFPLYLSYSTKTPSSPDTPTQAANPTPSGTTTLSHHPTPSGIPNPSETTTISHDPTPSGTPTLFETPTQATTTTPLATPIASPTPFVLLLHLATLPHLLNLPSPSGPHGPPYKTNLQYFP